MGLASDAVSELTDWSGFSDKETPAPVVTELKGILKKLPPIEISHTDGRRVRG